MTREQRARPIIDLIERLAIDHGTRAISKDAPASWSARFINIHPVWNAVLTRRSGCGEAQSTAAGTGHLATESADLLPNSIELWIQDALAFSAEFDDERRHIRVRKFRSGDWDEQLLDWAAAWIGDTIDRSASK